MSSESWPIRPWLWPSHIAGKRETGKLREEHNHVINEFHKLLNALHEIKEIPGNHNSEPDTMGRALEEIQRIATVALFKKEIA